MHRDVSGPDARFCASSEHGARFLLVATQMAHYVGVRFVNIVAPVESDKSPAAITPRLNPISRNQYLVPVACAEQTIGICSLFCVSAARVRISKSSPEFQTHRAS